MKLQLIAALLFLGFTLSAKAQSSIRLNKFEDVSLSDTVTLNSSEKEKWSNKIKPYFNENGKKLKAGQSVTGFNKKIQPEDFSYGSIDKKMCLLISKNTYVNTQPRIEESSRNVDLKMVYPQRNLINLPQP